MTIQKMRKIKLGNAGFSLVELIIVIAIMAILIAVLAPMFIRYVERSRISTDVSAVGSMGQALKTAAADPSLSNPPPTELELVWDTSSGTVSVTAVGGISGASAIYEAAVQAVVGGDGTNPVFARSTTVGSLDEVTITMVDVSVGRNSVAITGSAPSAENEAYFWDLISDLN